MSVSKLILIVLIALAAAVIVYLIGQPVVAAVDYLFGNLGNLIGGEST